MAHTWLFLNLSGKYSASSGWSSVLITGGKKYPSHNFKVLMGRIFFASKLTFASSTKFTSAQDFQKDWRSNRLLAESTLFPRLKTWLPLTFNIYVFFHQFTIQDVSDVNHEIRSFRVDSVDCWPGNREGASHAGEGTIYTSKTVTNVVDNSQNICCKEHTF